MSVFSTGDRAVALGEAVYQVLAQNNEITIHANRARSLINPTPEQRGEFNRTFYVSEAEALDHFNRITDICDALLENVTSVNKELGEYSFTDLSGSLHYVETGEELNRVIQLSIEKMWAKIQNRVIEKYQEGADLEEIRSMPRQITVKQGTVVVDNETDVELFVAEENRNYAFAWSNDQQEDETYIPHLLDMFSRSVLEEGEETILTNETICFRVDYRVVQIKVECSSK
jgi:hypothetical protein